MRIASALILAMLATALIVACSVEESPQKQAPPKQALERVTNQVAKSSPLGRAIKDFELRDFRGKAVKLSDFKDAKIVVVTFLGTECPLAKLYNSRLSELATRYAAGDVAFLGINANIQDSITEIVHSAKIHKLAFPILKDVGNHVADRFGAVRTPEAFVLDEHRVIRYWGRIDDQYGIGYQKPKVQQTYVRDAIEQLLAGGKVTTPTVQSVGCHIGRVRTPDAKSEVTYCNQISRLLQRRCVECHREGEIAPFALTSYDEVAGWGEMMDEVVEQQRMPPWHASPEHGKFSNDARLTDDEKQLLHRWVDAGMPEGDKKQLPPPRQFTKGWQISEPDLVIQINEQPFQIPAEGVVKYQYIVVDPGFTEDKWVRAAECRAGNRLVVHHIIAFVKPPGAKGVHSNSSIQNDWLVATAPGAKPMDLPDGMAKLVPAGSKLVFQMHYTPVGSPQEDASELGLVFADAKTVKKEVGTWRAVNPRFQIPAGASNHEVTASHTFKKDTLLLAMFPHMHLRGKSFRYEAFYPDGREEILLDIPNYDFNWQNGYVLAKPKRMPVGTKLLCTAHFDNSADNLANPDPTQSVRWGDQTWEEMMIGYFSMVLTDQDLRKEPQRKTRLDRFLEKYAGEKKPLIDKPLGELADKALDSQEAMARLGKALAALVPQLDRVDLAVVDDGKLSIRLDVQRADLRRAAGGRGVTIPARDLALTEYAAGDKTIVNDGFSKATQSDLKFMRRVFSSSMHLPVTIDGKPGTLNFWSEDPKAFPVQAVEFLEAVGKRMGQGR